MDEWIDVWRDDFEWRKEGWRNKNDLEEERKQNKEERREHKGTSLVIHD